MDQPPRRFAIGDVHGCRRTFRKLLAQVRFNPESDRLLLTGDLVNRGPRPIETLRDVQALGGAAVSVLGNHDLHALALAFGVGVPKAKDDFDGLFDARDRDELLAGLRAFPLLVREDDAVVVHAGLHPAWSLDDAETLAREIETMLRGPLGPSVLRGIYLAEFPPWEARMDRMTRLQSALSVLTRIRCVRSGGEPVYDFKGHPRDAPPGLVPWYVPRQGREPQLLVFGHWSALGYSRAGNAVCLDGGCYSGGSLFALDLRDGRVVEQPNEE